MYNEKKSDMYNMHIRKLKNSNVQNINIRNLNSLGFVNVGKNDLIDLCDENFKIHAVNLGLITSWTFCHKWLR